MIRTILTNWFQNWRTSSVGILMISGSVIHLVFAVRAGNATEGVWTASMVAIVGGIGFLVAPDAKLAQRESARLETKIDDTAAAMKSGDTSMLPKAAVRSTPPPTNV